MYTAADFYLTVLAASYTTRRPTCRVLRLGRRADLEPALNLVLRNVSHNIVLIMSPLSPWYARTILPASCIFHLHAMLKKSCKLKQTTFTAWNKISSPITFVVKSNRINIYSWNVRYQYCAVGPLDSRQQIKYTTVCTVEAPQRRPLILTRTRLAKPNPTK
jgi:hypothetical protein